jgi:hypothetical protein
MVLSVRQLQAPALSKAENKLKADLNQQIATYEILLQAVLPLSDCR